MARFKTGDRVLYAGAWGAKTPRETTITGEGEKNGRLVYDNALGLWGYADQYTPADETARGFTVVKMDEAGASVEKRVMPEALHEELFRVFGE